MSWSPNQAIHLTSLSLRKLPSQEGRPKTVGIATVLLKSEARIGRRAHWQAGRKVRRIDRLLACLGYVRIATMYMLPGPHVPASHIGSSGTYRIPTFTESLLSHRPNENEHGVLGNFGIALPERVCEVGILEAVYKELFGRA